MIVKLLNLNPPNDPNFWQQDKIEHYKWGYSETNKTRGSSKKIWGLDVFFTMVIMKEVVADKMLNFITKGHCDWGDVQADWAGCSDAWNNKPSKF